MYCMNKAREGFPKCDIRRQWCVHVLRKIWNAHYTRLYKISAHKKRRWCGGGSERLKGKGLAF